MNLFRLLLLPFSLIYGIITFIRNKFFDWGIFKSTAFKIPIISVGNLEVGGSGKTPLVAYIINLLKDNNQIATLSRGYGRKTKGFLWVKADGLASNTGDEPLQIKQSFPDVKVAVCENRVFGIEQIQAKADLILMDDAFQHRAVKPGFSILLFDYNQLQKPKFLLPAGNYREFFGGRKRADILVVSKCTADLSVEKKREIISALKPYPNQQVFFSYIKYQSTLKSVFGDDDFEVTNLKSKKNVLVLTGIAKPKILINKVKQHVEVIRHHSYPDHHQFTQKNMLKLANDFKMLATEDKIIITTQKDAVRLRSELFKKILSGLPIFEWPIETDFFETDKLEFDKIILKYAQGN